MKNLILILLSTTLWIGNSVSEYSVNSGTYHTYLDFTAGADFTAIGEDPFDVHVKFDIEIVNDDVSQLQSTLVGSGTYSMDYYSVHVNPNVFEPNTIDIIIYGEYNGQPTVHIVVIDTSGAWSVYSPDGQMGFINVSYY